MFKNTIYSKGVLFLCILLFALFFCVAYFSDATFDAGDGIRHYLVSRYSWKHPDLLLYSWGKPFFTIVSSPFSQFGFMGMAVFNILCGIGAAFFSYKIAKQLNLNYAFLAIPFLLFTPCFFPTLNSGLTEPFFAFVLIASIYLVFIERYFFACILVSFLPFIRTEGNMILPLFFIVLIYRKKFLSIPLLAFGTFVYSLIGYFYFNDFFWIKNQNPYDGANRAFYGSGELLHFVKSYNFIWGSALTILFGCGLLMLLLFCIKTIKARELKESKLPEELILIYGSFAVYFIAHSIMWWKGLANSLGLLRVIAGVAPCSALICLRGLQLIAIPYVREKKILHWAVISILTFWVIRSPFKHEYFPYKLDKEQELIKEAGDWFKSSEYTQEKVYYLYPYLAHVLNVDSFDPNKVGELWGLYPTIKEWGIGAIPDSTIVFWDAHFGPNECKIPLDTIMNDPNFELIKTFKPTTPFQVLGGYDFAVYVFLKLEKPKEMEVLSSDFIQLEEQQPFLENTNTISTSKSFSGKNSSMLSAQNEYSVTINRSVSSIPSGTKKVIVNFKLFDPNNNSQNAVTVLSIDDETKKNLLWVGEPIQKEQPDSAGWTTVSASFLISETIKDEQKKDTMKIYIWNKEKKEFYIDDIKIDFWGFSKN
ncbi:MAG: hypothetical protein IPP64_00510 [Bacteroidetes bacterium]|nr:hypothetical protein [Bacteroidota bacterium]